MSDQIEQGLLRTKAPYIVRYDPTLKFPWIIRVSVHATKMPLEKRLDLMDQGIEWRDSERFLMPQACLLRYRSLVSDWVAAEMVRPVLSRLASAT